MIKDVMKTPYRMVTMNHRRDGMVFELTQRLHPKHDFGHYFWTLRDLDNNILTCGYSTGSPKDQLDTVDIFKMAEDRMKEYLGVTAFERKTKGEA